MSNSLQSHGHTRLPCPSLSPGVYSDSCPLMQWCHPTIPLTVTPCPPALNPSQHQGPLQGVSSVYQVVCAESFSHVQLFATPRTAACQAPLSMGFSRQEWVSMPSSRASSPPKDQTQVSCTTSQVLPLWKHISHCLWLFCISVFPFRLKTLRKQRAPFCVYSPLHLFST